MSDSDKQIIEGLKAGERLAVDLLYQQYYKSLCSYGYKLLQDISSAEEIVQELIFTMWEKKVEIQSPSLLKSYMFRSVHNNAVRMIKVRRRFDDIDGEDMHEVAVSDSEKIDSIIEQEEMKQAIGSALAKLPDQTRTIFKLCKVEDLSHKEAAEIENLSTKSIEYHLSKAIKFLRKELKGIGTVFVVVFAGVFIREILTCILF